ncbi:ABC transporter permease [Streptomyces paludis]|uniref:ABC transporter permease n=1 Tax=Streptomyces paludis TaxID=2282738 RepID=A0A345HUE6_9ACTN|nr:ABC transporter permease [Streptomyces paludis]AXG80320.1 ABC transporter permease [Streptomyces paludis]
MTTPYQQIPAQHPQPPQPPQAPGGGYGYVSPIPARRAHLGDALTSEWTKIRSVRSTMWTLGVMVALMVGIGLLAAWLVALASSYDPETDASGENMLMLGFYGMLLGSMCVITLGALTMTSEFGTGMIRSTLTACPSRGRVLAAKSMVFFGLVFSVSTVTTLVVGALQVAILDGRTPTYGEWFRATAGASFYLATLGLLSLAVGAMVRHSAGAVTTMLGVVLLPLILAIFMFSESLTSIREFLLEYNIPIQMAVFYGMTDAVSGTSSPSAWQPLWILLGVTVVAMAGAYASLHRRDV